ncbi:hypothetical protein EDD36DRAFT_154135 [Exophiala viscosa]|uniref:Uncharacterized protein n=1 Tax=Exophiala viscosa TaxID=2486360 RepID=A0AAN6E4W0_9EURO|nr:hypothetical protein EDD36DRAFT_154135 [Exophiala viscosa]
MSVAHPFVMLMWSSMSWTDDFPDLVSNDITLSSWCNTAVSLSVSRPHAVHMQDYPKLYDHPGKHIPLSLYNACSTKSHIFVAEGIRRLADTYITRPMDLSFIPFSCPIPYSDPSLAPSTVHNHEALVSTCPFRCWESYSCSLCLRLVSLDLASHPTLAYVFAQALHI